MCDDRLSDVEDDLEEEYVYNWFLIERWYIFNKDDFIINAFK
jgi:hypothetical protein